VFDEHFTAAAKAVFVLLNQVIFGLTGDFCLARIKPKLDKAFSYTALILWSKVYGSQHQISRCDLTAARCALARDGLFGHAGCESSLSALVIYPQAQRLNGEIDAGCS